MQDINRGNTFDENESLSLDKKNRKSSQNKVGTAFKELDKSRKIAVIFLAFFSVFLFFAWGITTKNRIDNPLKPKIDESVAQKQIDESSDTSNKDSDGDGLTDWEEENMYNTSPYLEDTDGDGILDSKEVNDGTDPNCVEGNDCSSVDVLQEQVKKQAEMDSFIDKNINLEISTTSGNGTISEDSMTKALQGESDVTTLRKMLIDAGMDEKILKAISDEDLLNSYKEILQ